MVLPSPQPFLGALVYTVPKYVFSSIAASELDITFNYHRISCLFFSKHSSFLIEHEYGLQPSKSAGSMDPSSRL